MFVLSDADGNNTIDKKEVVMFMRLAISIKKGAFEEAIFQKADTNYDDIVEKKEL